MNLNLSEVMTNPKVEDVPALVEELVNLQGFVKNFSRGIESQLDEIEKTRQEFLAENQRLLMVKDSLQVERDACVSLIIKLGLKLGLQAGRLPENQVALNLPSGQVIWSYGAEEAHLFEALPEYLGDATPSQSQSIEETYTRVMNPSL